MLAIENLHKSYRRHANVVPVLRGLSLRVHAGEFLSIVGASGSGKSTLLHLMGVLDTPDQGAISLEDNKAEQVLASAVAGKPRPLQIEKNVAGRWGWQARVSTASPICGQAWFQL